MARDAATYRTNQRTTHKTTGADTWIGNGLAMLLAGLGIAAGVIGLMIAFGYLHDGTPRPFEDGMSWLLPGVVLSLVANLFRREHHVVDETMDDRMNKASDMDVWAGMGLGTILAGLAVACAVVGLLVNFLAIKDTNPNPFQDALVWFTSGSILGLSSLVCRRERPVNDTTDLVRRDSNDREGNETTPRRESFRTDR